MGLSKIRDVIPYEIHWEVQQVEHYQQVEGGDPSFLLSPGEAHLKYWVQVRAPQHLGGRNIPDRIQEKVKMVLRGLEDLS